MEFLDSKPDSTMQQHHHVEDADWDAVFTLEEQHYQEGCQEGQEAARTSGILEEGQRGGFLKGYALGFEVGFMASVAEFNLRGLTRPDAAVPNNSASTTSTGTEKACDNSCAHSSSSCCKSKESNPSEIQVNGLATSVMAMSEEEGPQTTQERSKESRQVRRMLELQQACNHVPLDNHEEVDFDEVIAHLRSLYKQTGSSLGVFPPVRAGKKEVHHDW